MIDEKLLNDADALAAADPQGVLLAVASAGAQVRATVGLVAEAGVEAWKDLPRPRSLVIAARGGSVAVAEAVTALIGQVGPMPVVTVTGGVLPPWVGPLDVVIAVSVIPGERNTLALAHEAARRGSVLLTVGVADGGLSEAAERARGVHVEIPARQHGVTAPQTALTSFWSMLTPALVGVHMLGLLRREVGEIDALADVLDAEAEACRPSSDVFVNPAKALALELDGAVPLLLGADEVAGVAAHRGSTVFARTSRIPVLHGALPHDADNVVSTFSGPFVGGVDDLFHDPEFDDASGAKLRLALLGREDEPTVKAMRDIAVTAGVKVSHVPCDEGNDLTRLAQLIARLDFASVYSALGQGMDPALNPHVADLREALG